MFDNGLRKGAEGGGSLQYTSMCRLSRPKSLSDKISTTQPHKSVFMFIQMTNTMIGENRLLVTDAPVELEK